MGAYLRRHMKFSAKEVEETLEEIHYAKVGMAYKTDI
jgi:hypothetical protein